MQGAVLCAAVPVLYIWVVIYKFSCDNSLPFSSYSLSHTHIHTHTYGEIQVAGKAGQASKHVALANTPQN